MCSSFSCGKGNPDKVVFYPNPGAGYGANLMGAAVHNGPDGVSDGGVDPAVTKEQDANRGKEQNDARHPEGGKRAVRDPDG